MRHARPDIPPRQRIPLASVAAPADADALAVQPTTSTSVSALEAFNRCARLWWFQHGRGLTAPSSPAQAEGQAVHRDYETGACQHPSVALAVQDGLLPPPGTYVEHEREFWLTLPDGPWLHGFMDVVDSRGGVVLSDLKTRATGTAARKYASSPHVLHSDLQLGCYVGVLFAEDDPQQERIPAGHVYLSRDPTDPAALRVDIPGGGLDRATAALRLERAADMHARAVQAVPLKLSQVPPTRSACGAFGGCPFRAICDAADAASILGGSMLNPPPLSAPTSAANIDQLLAARASPAVPPPPPPAPPTPPPQPAAQITDSAAPVRVGLWSQARGAVVELQVQRVGAGWLARIVAAPEVTGTGANPALAGQVALAAYDAPVTASTTTIAGPQPYLAEAPKAELTKTEPTKAEEPATASSAPDKPRKADLTGIDLTPPEGAAPWSGRGRHPAWLAERVKAAAAPASPQATPPATATPAAQPTKIQEAVAELVAARRTLRRAEAAQEAANRAYGACAAEVVRAEKRLDAALDAVSDLI